MHREFVARELNGKPVERGQPDPWPHLRNMVYVCPTSVGGWNCCCLSVTRGLLPCTFSTAFNNRVKWVAVMVLRKSTPQLRGKVSVLRGAAAKSCQR